MAVGQLYIDALHRFTVPGSAEAVDDELFRFAANSPALISDEDMRQRIRKVALPLSTCMETLERRKAQYGFASLCQAALAYALCKDQALPLEQRFPSVIVQLQESPLGREMMLRVLKIIWAASSIPVPERPQFIMNNSREEVAQSALLLGAQSCRAEFL